MMSLVNEPGANPLPTQESCVDRVIEPTHQLRTRLRDHEPVGRHSVLTDTDKVQVLVTSRRPYVARGSAHRVGDVDALCHGGQGGFLQPRIILCHGAKIDAFEGYRPVKVRQYCSVSPGI